MGALRNFLSVDELKISVVVVCLLFSFSFILYLYYMKQPVEPGLLDLVKACIYSVTTINSVNAISYGYGYYSKTDGSTTQTSTPTWGSGVTTPPGINQGNLTPNPMSTSGETEMKPESTTINSTNPTPTQISTSSTSKPTI
jgi:hypothetical protein